MAKKIRFPLEMKNSVQVRTLSELKEHWDIEKIEGYFLDGKLETWLRDRYCEAEAEKVSDLDSDDKKRRQKLCEIFGMEYEADDEDLADAEELRDKQTRLDKLRQYTTDRNILEHIDHVAFDTEEILDAIDAGAETIYLVNNEFEIPLQVKDKEYIGVGRAIAKIDSQEPVDFEALGIRFENVQFDAKYAEVSKAENFNEKFRALFEAEEYEKAKAYCIKAAENGNAYAMFIVGDGYHGGNDKWFGEEDQQKALEWFEKSAEAGYPDAMLALGYMYSCCNEIESDIEKAIFWCKKCAETGNEAAMRHLGEFYENEKYEGCDKETAIAWYRKAAEKGDAEAMNALGNCYDRGEGVTEDKKEAVKWFRKSAEAGSAIAMYNMGFSYSTGDGIEQDKRKAIFWYRKAAEAGFPAAMKQLALAYENGEGVQKSYNQAQKWRKKAIEAGYEESQEESADNGDMLAVWSEFIFKLNQLRPLAADVGLSGLFSLSVYSVYFSYDNSLVYVDILDNLIKREIIPSSDNIICYLRDQHPTSDGGIIFTDEAVIDYPIDGDQFFIFPYKDIVDVSYDDYSLSVTTTERTYDDFKLDGWNPANIGLFLQTVIGVRPSDQAEQAVLRGIVLDALGGKSIYDSLK